MSYTNLVRKKEWEKEYYKEHREERHNYVMGIKEQVVRHYGGGKAACVECNELRLVCLSIDHVNGGGKQHKLKIGQKGYGFYLWLRRHNYPEGYQTLCMNCQFIKRLENRELRR